MTPFTLSASAQAAINTAINSGTGTNNANYIAAYNAIYNDLVVRNAGGNIIAPEVLAWFRQAPLVNGEQWNPTAQGTFIWDYTVSAAFTEGAIITNSDLHNASDAIALKVFTTLKGNPAQPTFLFDSNAGAAFSMPEIVKTDAGAGVQVLKNLHLSAGLDNAIWGGTLFARTELNDPTYFADYNLTLALGTREATAIIAGLMGGGVGILGSNQTIFNTALADAGNLDWEAIADCFNPILPTDIQSSWLTNPTWSFSAGASTPSSFSNQVSNGNIKIYDALSGGYFTLTNSIGSSAAGEAVVYADKNMSVNIPASGNLSLINGLSSNGTAEIVNTTLGTTSFLDVLGNQFASYTPTDNMAGGSVKVNGDKIEAYDAGNKLKNSTQEIDLGTNTSGVLDKTYATNFTQLILPVGWPTGSTSPTAFGINDNGDVAGSYYVPFAQGFLYQNGTYSQFSPMSSGYNYVEDINNSGTVVGFVDTNNGLTGVQYQNGTVTTINDPSAGVGGDTVIMGINNAGTEVGYSRGNGSLKPFIYSSSVLTDITTPWSAASFVDINDNGAIVGNASRPASAGTLYTSYIGGGGFVYKDGVFTQIIAPNATSAGGFTPWTATNVAGINNNNIIVGTYWDDSYGTDLHGFVDNNGIFSTVDYPGAFTTVITGINNNNEITGYAYTNANPSVATAFTANLDGIVTSQFYLENSGNVDLTASTELADATVNLVAGNNAITFGASKNTVNGALGATLYNFGAVFAQDIINNASGGNTAANGEIDFISSTITKQKLWLTQSGNDLVVRLLGTAETVTVSGWFGSNAGAKTLALKTADGLELTPTRVATLVTAMATYQSGHSSFNPATATTMPTDTTLQNAITAAWIKYDTLTTNGDGSKTGILNDHTGANWTYIEDSLTAAGLLNDTFQQFDDNSNIFTDYNLSGLDGWTKGVHKTNAIGQETESIVTYVDDSYDDITHFFSGTIRAIDNYYNAENVLLDTFQDNFDNSSVETSFNPSGDGGWIKGVHHKNTLGQETEDIITYVDNTYDDITHNLSGGLLDTTDDYHRADGTLVNTTKEFTDGSEISIDYDNDGQNWATGTRAYDPSHNLLQTDVMYDDGGHWIYASTFATTLNGGTGYNGYEFTASTIGNDTINNGGGTTAHGEIDFDDSSITKSKLWFKQAGNDLTVQKLGSSNKITVAGWYTSGQAGNEVQSIHAGGLTLDTQVAQLVNAMASYQSSHSSFNADTATTMPTDTTLQNAITAAWHS